MALDLVPIGTFSLLSGLSVPALRHYAQTGLLTPADVDPDTGYRRYSRSQLARARMIRALRLVDLPLEEVGRALDGGPDEMSAVLRAHRERLTEAGEELRRKAAAVDEYLRRGMIMQGVQGVRLATLNLGVISEEELKQATGFWSSLFGEDFEDWGQGSLQIRLGQADDFHVFNFRIRGPEDAQFGHHAAFGLMVDDLDDFHGRALAAGAKEHYGPVDAEGTPRHSLFEDPVGNRVVLWQG